MYTLKMGLFSCPVRKIPKAWVYHEKPIFTAFVVFTISEVDNVGDDYPPNSHTLHIHCWKNAHLMFSYGAVHE